MESVLTKSEVERIWNEQRDERGNLRPLPPWPEYIEQRLPKAIRRASSTPDDGSLIAWLEGSLREAKHGHLATVLISRQWKNCEEHPNCFVQFLHNVTGVPTRVDRHNESGPCDEFIRFSDR